MEHRGHVLLHNLKQELKAESIASKQRRNSGILCTLQDSTFVVIRIIIFSVKEYALLKDNDCRLLILFVSYEK